MRVWRVRRVSWAKHRNMHTHVRNVRRHSGEKMVRVPALNAIFLKRRLNWMKLARQHTHTRLRRLDDMVCAARVPAAHERNRHARHFESKRPFELIKVGHLYGCSRRGVLKQQGDPRAFDTCVPRTVPKTAIKKDRFPIVYGGLNQLG